MRRVVLLLVGSALLSGAVAPRARAQEDARYQTTIEQAVREFGLSNWAEARALFRRAHALSPSARTLRGMGMAAFELKMYVEALRELTAALADTQRPLTNDQRGQVQSLIDQSRAFVGRYRVTLDPPSARPTVDAQEALFEPGNVLLLSLGDHVVAATAEGYQQVSVPLRVEGGENLELRIALTKAAAAAPLPVAVAAAGAAPAPAAADTPARGATAPPPPAGSGGLVTAAWITLAGAALLGGAAAAFWLVGEGNYDDLNNLCGKTNAGCSDQQIADSGVETADLLTTVFLIGSGAAAVTSGVLFAVGAGSGDEAPPAVALHLGPTGIAARGSF